jgi:2-beta-glucuronyltransferase
LPTPRALLVTGHYYASRRKAGFHFLADALAGLGFAVTVATVGISPISRLRGDARMAYPVRAEANRPVEKAPGIVSLVWWTPWHPFHLRSAWLDRLSAPLAARWADLPLGPLEAAVRGADLVLVESGLPLLLVRRIRALNPAARLVYRVSDDTRNIGQHAHVVAEEDRVAPLFDLISAPSRYTAERFAALPSVRFQPHGIDLAAFDRPTADPYAAPPLGPRWETEVVSIGHSFFDAAFPALAATALPGWRFHVVGALRPEPTLPNVVWHGERPFLETVPFVRHADVGAAPYVRRTGGETLRESSLKLIQYTHCRLPSVGPRFVTRPDRPHLIGYDPGDGASIAAALRAARAIDRRTIRPEPVASWEDLARAICAAVGYAVPEPARVGRTGG